MIKFVVPILTFDKEQTIDFYSKLGFVVVSKDLLLRESSIYTSMRAPLKVLLIERKAMN